MSVNINYHERRKVDGKLIGYGRTGYFMTTYLSKALVSPGKSFVTAKAHPAIRGQSLLQGTTFHSDTQ